MLRLSLTQHCILMLFFGNFGGNGAILFSHVTIIADSALCFNAILGAIFGIMVHNMETGSCFCSSD